MCQGEKGREEVSARGCVGQGQRSDQSRGQFPHLEDGMQMKDNHTATL